MRQHLSEEMEIPWAEDLGKYLGVPIFHNKPSPNTFQFMIDKVHQRLSAWKVKSISFVGIMTLTKSVLQALPTYVMQTTIFPKSIWDNVDKACKNFIWGCSSTDKKMHLVSWDKMCNPKEHGGLGLRKMRRVNQSYMM
ncbi:hypothetical protein AAZX31_17G186400 [Glycine max]